MEIGRYRGQYGRMQIQEVEKDGWIRLERGWMCVSAVHMCNVQLSLPPAGGAGQVKAAATAIP